MTANHPFIDYKIVWEPIPDSSQELAIDSPCDHTLYHGTRGPGKTATQLMRFRRYVGLGYGTYWRGVIFDKEYKHLGDIIEQSKKFFSLFNDGARFLSSASELKWVWPTGEELLFRHVKKESDYDSFHGHEYPFIGWNELTKHATPKLYDKMMSTNRTSFVSWKHTPNDEFVSGDTDNAILCDDGLYRVYHTDDYKPLPDIPLQCFSTTNPNGPGHNWVKRRFIDPAENGEIVKVKTIVFDPRIQEEREVTKTQVAIFGSYKENIYLTAEYIAELDRLTKNDENLKRAWLFGDWDVTAGGALDDLWHSKTHILPRFVVPESWYIDRAFDWGSTHPFSVGWWAEANGEEAIIIENGKQYTFTPPAGTLIQIFEWYGAKEIGINEGLKMGATEIALGIIDREISMMANGWIETQPSAGPADNQISNVNEVDSDTIEKKMLDKGIRWEKSNKSAGSRKQGLQIIRERLAASISGEGPGLYFMRNCKASIETLPSLQRDEKDPDDIDTTQEDHCYDQVRYRMLKSDKRTGGKIKIKFGS